MCRRPRPERCCTLTPLPILLVVALSLNRNSVAFFMQFQLTPEVQIVYSEHRITNIARVHPSGLPLDPSLEQTEFNSPWSQHFVKSYNCKSEAPPVLGCSEFRFS